MVIPSQSLPVIETAAIPLAAYAQHIKVCECAFFGVRDAPDSLCRFVDCRDIWTKDERDYAAYYLAEAQYEIEQVLNYFVGKRWVTDERHMTKNPLITKWGYVQSGGVQATSAIATGAAVNHATDPAIVGPVATTVTDEAEVFVYHPGTAIPITPSSITIAGGNLTIQIPRCRIVKPSLQDNNASGVLYTNVNNFSQTVDIVRVYNDTSTEAKLIKTNCADCDETEADACIYVRQSDIGSVMVKQGNCAVLPGCNCYSAIDLNYYAGRDIYDDSGNPTAFGRQAIDSIIRLAHVKMPTTPCECDPVRELWRRDRMVFADANGRAVRGVSPFGPEEGAWIAWQFANSGGMKLVKGATI